MSEILDVLVIGAGPAGLTGAVYLGRYRRRVVVIDGGDSRAAWIPVSHNYPGFSDGLPGPDLLERMRCQARLYGATIHDGRVEALDLAKAVFTATLHGGRTLRARAVLLATGVKDNEPALPGVFEAVQRGVLRICPICDGYEATGQRIAVLGVGDHGAGEAVFLRTYSPHVAYIHVGQPHLLSADARDQLQAAGVEVVESEISAVHVKADRITALDFADEVQRAFDTVYSAFGATPRRLLAERLGAKVDEDRRLIVDDHQQTTVRGLYAAGDVVRGLNQITVAQGEAAIAATAIHNDLRLRGFQGPHYQPSTVADEMSRSPEDDAAA